MEFGIRNAEKSRTRKKYESATNSIARKGSRGGLRPFSSAPCRVKGGLRPFSSVPCGVWGNASTVPRATSTSKALNKGAGSEASLPVTLRVRRRAPKLLFSPRFREKPKKLPSRKQFFEKAGNSLVDSEHLCGQIPLACVGQDDDDVLAREFRTRRHLRCRPDRRA